MSHCGPVVGYNWAAFAIVIYVLLVIILRAGWFGAY